jgi:hypothetical protein
MLTGARVVVIASAVVPKERRRKRIIERYDMTAFGGEG